MKIAYECCDCGAINIFNSGIAIDCCCLSCDSNKFVLSESNIFIEPSQTLTVSINGIEDVKKQLQEINELIEEVQNKASNLKLKVEEK